MGQAAFAFQYNKPLLWFSCLNLRGLLSVRFVISIQMTDLAAQFRRCISHRLPSPLVALTPAPTNLRWLYLLALFQLVAGPLVLVTVLTFCEITVRETPTQGLTEALSAAWHSSEVQSLIQNATGVPVDDSNAPLPVDSGRQEGKKMTWCVWQKPTIKDWTWPVENTAGFTRLSVWTPAWPQAPPGPPPRVA